MRHLKFLVFFLVFPSSVLATTVLTDFTATLISFVADFVALSVFFIGLASIYISLRYAAKTLGVGFGGRSTSPRDSPPPWPP